MKLLARRLNQKTGKQQILLYCPKTADDKQNAKMEKVLSDLFLRHSLPTEYIDNDDNLYQNVDTQLCFIAFCSGEWMGQIAQMEKDWLGFKDKTRLMMVVHEFKAEYYYLEKRLNRLPNGKFADKEVQRLFEFYHKAFEAAAEYQGNAKDKQWCDADDFDL